MFKNKKALQIRPSSHSVSGVPHYLQGECVTVSCNLLTFLESFTKSNVH